MSDVPVRPVTRRGCGYPKPGGVYLESQEEAGGTLPIIVVIDPPIPHDHFHRGWVYIDLDDMLAKRQVSYVGMADQGWTGDSVPRYRCAHSGQCGLATWCARRGECVASRADLT